MVVRSQEPEQLVPNQGLEKLLVSQGQGAMGPRQRGQEEGGEEGRAQPEHHRQTVSSGVITGCCREGGVREGTKGSHQKKAYLFGLKCTF